MNLGNLSFALGSVNPSGIGEKIYRIRKALINSWPTIVDDQSAEGASVDTYAKYTGDFVTAQGAVWNEIYSTQGKGSVTFEQTGEVDCKMFTNHLNASFPDLDANALAYSKASVNDDFVYLAKSKGRWHVIGSPDYRSNSVISGASGDAAGSAKGLTIAVDCPDVSPLPIYAGDIAVTGGTIDLATSTFTPTPGA